MNRRSLMPSAFCVAMLLATALDADEQTLYTWVDASGTVHYSDKPEDPGARAVGLTSRRTDPARVANEQAARQTRREERDQAMADAAAAAAEEEQEARERARNCERAQARLRMLSVARRPFRVDENGQQIYLTAGQIVEEQTQAQAQVNEWCN